jgi:Flp pilus assembly protein TadD
MKTLFISALAAVTMAGVAQAQTPTTGEIGYSRGSLGYDALVAGDNERAIAQILAEARIDRNDPARMINLGQAYARTGRTGEAAELFKAVIKSRDEVDLILADGSVMSSKDAAAKALGKLRSRIASR